MKAEKEEAGRQTCKNEKKPKKQKTQARNTHFPTSLLLIAAYLVPVIPSSNMNGHINETAPPLVPIGEVKLVQV